MRDEPREVETDVGAGPEGAVERREPRRRTWLLMMLLGLIAFLAGRVGGPGEAGAQDLAFVATHGPPPVVEATGQLAEVFAAARPATVRVEARCANRHAMIRGPVGVGTGFFISADGQLLTAYHVVEQSSVQGCPLRYLAVDADERSYPLELVGFDAYLDLALLQADVKGEVPFLPLASRESRPGFDVVAIGNSRGEFLEDRAGRISRIGVQAGRADFADGTIELTAALAPGDSGGPVVNRRGEAIGVVSYISFRPGDMGTDGAGYVPPFLRGLTLPQSGFASYAVPVDAGSEAVAAIRAGARRDVPVIGFSWDGFDYRPGEIVGVDLGPLPGPVVAQVAPRGPAAEAGLRGFSQSAVLDRDGQRVGVAIEADVIVAVDGEPTPGFYELLAVIREKEVGQRVTLTVQRGGRVVELELELGAKRDVFF